VQEKLSEFPFVGGAGRWEGGGGAGVGYKCAPIFIRALFEFYTRILHCSSKRRVMCFGLVNKGRVSRHGKLWTASPLHNGRIMWTSLSSSGRSFHFYRKHD